MHYLCNSPYNALYGLMNKLKPQL